MIKAAADCQTNAMLREETLVDYCPQVHQFLLYHQVETQSPLHKPLKQRRGQTAGDDQGNVQTERHRLPSGVQPLRRVSNLLWIGNYLCLMRSVLVGPAGESGKQGGKQEQGEEAELGPEGGGQRQVVATERRKAGKMQKGNEGIHQG